MARSCGASAGRKPLDPGRKAHRRNGLVAAEPGEQAVIAPAGDQLPGGASLRIVQLEHEARVVIEAAAEGGRELDPADVDAARGQKAGAALEQIERSVKLERAILGDSAQLSRRLVRI